MRALAIVVGMVVGLLCALVLAGLTDASGLVVLALLPAGALGGAYGAYHIATGITEELQEEAEPPEPAAEAGGPEASRPEPAASAVPAAEAGRPEASRPEPAASAVPAAPSEPGSAPRSAAAGAGPPSSGSLGRQVTTLVVGGGAGLGCLWISLARDWPTAAVVLMPVFGALTGAAVVSLAWNENSETREAVRFGSGTLGALAGALVGWEPFAAEPVSGVLMMPWILICAAIGGAGGYALASVAVGILRLAIERGD